MSKLSEAKGVAELERLHPLFDHAISRTSDPLTSHESASDTAPKLNEIQSRMLSAFRRGPLTANEAAGLCLQAGGGCRETLRKRAGELREKGLIEECGSRKCKVTGKRARTFKAVAKK